MILRKMALSSKRVCIVFGMVIGLLGLTVAGRATLPPPIAPMFASVHFSRADAEHPWAQYITTPSGTRLYIITLQPEYALGNRLAGVNLVLRKTEGTDTHLNLLNPYGRHGMQPYIFNAMDLRNGIDKSAYGRARKIKVGALGLVVDIDLKQARVNVGPHPDLPGTMRSPEISKERPRYPQLDDLWFDVRVGPLDASGGSSATPSAAQSPGG